MGDAPDKEPLHQYHNSIRVSHQTGQRIGLIAGGGRFPIRFAQAAQAQGHSVFCVGVIGMVSEELRDICEGFVTAPLGRMAKAISHFKRARVNHVVMAGKIEKTVFFKPFGIIRHFPDWRALHMLYRYARENRTDDTLLLAVIKEFERDNLNFASALDFCPELLVEHGFLTRKRPNMKQWEDIKFGWEMAKEMGRLDVGQTVVVFDKAVIAVEAIEGTDRAIERAGQLCRRGSLTVVKVAKPQQDMRFDVPTIGPQTIQTMHKAGARVLAIESGKTILLDEDEVKRLANKFGISLVSLNSEESQLSMVS